jgi:hypothetical protein
METLWNVITPWLVKLWALLSLPIKQSIAGIIIPVIIIPILYYILLCLGQLAQ